MNQFRNTSSKSLGDYLKAQRKARHLSQAELSDGICSQSMISGIEKGNYIPSSLLLAQICHKLQISLNDTVLSDYFEFSNFQSASHKIEQLCNEHRYAELIKFMNNEDILASLDSNDDFQKYYYYYGCATYQLSKQADPALRYLQLALQYTYHTDKKYLSSIELLIISAINLIKVKSSHYTKMDNHNFEIAFASTINQAYVDYSENLNIIFYQYALALFHEEQIKNAIHVLNTGIEWITSKNSTFMIADLYFLLAKCYEKTAKLKNKNEALNNATVLAKVYKQVVNKEL
ncbi:helix-turn-helix domain-containing protein [Fructilactobacillus hinvesii]|uniref:Helix-turn-helix domain-containing protein n=1 Tax=Fructilactobacillus hinvesii TaxID=2940300 RepID=A0ABY5BVA7_9LACO|nr:helix-turn-helix transcriptional regulator [Fructilactobacillus hinvesii]USS88511.1 helix-turn-helix domain-containing protein [Fructilactobacillus hinvesii]